MTLKQRIIATLLGLLSIGVPAEIINAVTFNLNPGIVFVGVALASLTGYAYGSWRTSLDPTDEPEQEVVPTEAELNSICPCCDMPVGGLYHSMRPCGQPEAQQ